MIAPWSWNGNDVADSSYVAVHCGIVQHIDHSDAVLESSIELQTRAPRITDAWRFFRAAQLLAKPFPHVAAVAQRHGARIALAVTGWLCVDGHLIEVGASSAIALTVVKALRPVTLPPEVAAVITEDGRALLFGPDTAEALAR